MKNLSVEKIIIFIAVITLISGLGQLFLPGWVLFFVGAESTDTSKHFFAIVGMFMALFGGLLMYAMKYPQEQGAAIFVSGLQKLGASIAVGIGVFNGTFSWVALSVAGFDLFSFALIMYYFIRLRCDDED